VHKRRLLKLAQALESPAAERHFDMANWFEHTGLHSLPGNMPVGKAIQDCGTVACIAGWAVAVHEPKLKLCDAPVGAVFERAKKLLGLDELVAKYLFLPASAPHVDENFLNVYGANPKQAARVVRHLVETGEVDWRVAFSGD
jgi:hypothetical protein